MLNSTAKWPPAQPLSEAAPAARSEEHTSELQSQSNRVCRLLLEKKNSASPFNPPQIQGFCDILSSVLVRDRAAPLTQHHRRYRLLASTACDVVGAAGAFMLSIRE